MTSVRNAFVAGVSALGMLAASVTAEAAPTNAPKTIGGVDYKDIQTVGHHGGHGFGGGGRGFGGGGRHFGGGGWGGGGRHWGGGGWGGGRHWGGGSRYGYYRGHHHHGWGGGGYLAAGVLGLAAGAALSDPYYGGYGYGGGYYDDGYGYYDAPARCRVARRAYDRYGRPIRVIRYVPC